MRRTASAPLALTAAALALALLLSAAARRADAVPPHDATHLPTPPHLHHPHGDGDVAALRSTAVDTRFLGTIEGTVTAPPRAMRRVTNPYAPGSAPHEVPPMPMVAFVEGRVAGAAPARPSRPQLAQEDTMFQPSLLVVPANTTVQFPNHDPFFHNVFSYSSVARFDLGRYPRGEFRTVAFERAGQVKVFCEVHRWMRAAVVVVENPFHAEVRNGRFTLPNVPPGRYRVSVWDFDRGKKTVTVDVPAQGVARAALAF